MKKYYILFAVMMLCVMLSAQTQQGYVKTKGRMVNGQIVHGQGLKGTTVCIKGKTAVLVKTEDGAFSFPVPEAQFRVDSVRKKGYQLVDMDALSKIYKHSPNPIFLVMETPEQQLQDQLDAERKIRRTLIDQLHQREDDIEALKKQQKISDEEYRQALQKLYEETDQNEQLVKDMVERYSTIDYDQLSEFDQKISELILNGELVKADSMLRTKGDINKRVEQYRKHEAINAKEKEELVQRQEQLEQSELLAQKELEDLANDCYRKFEICKMRHENDSAAYYLKLRASLDATNFQWMIDAGDFLYEYLADFQNALSFYQQCLKLSIERDGLLNKWVSLCYNDIGILYGDTGLSDSAIYYFQRSINIDSTLFGENSTNNTITYNNLGDTYSSLGAYDEALRCFEKALNISVLLDDNLNKAMSLNNIGTIYLYLDKYDDALKLFNEALCIHIKESGENSLKVADVYGNLGFLYGQKEDFDTALIYHIKALNIRKLVLSENHPDIALNNNNVGITYLRMGEPDKGLEYLEQALSIRKYLFGENHPSVATCYDNIGGAYSIMNNHEKEREYYEKALSIRIAVLDENHPDIAYSYNNIGALCIQTGDYEKAIDYLNNALIILESIHGKNHSSVAWTLYNLGGAYSESGNYEKGLDCFERCLEIRLTTLGEDHPKTIKTKQKISETQSKLKEQENEQKNE